MDQESGEEKQLTTAEYTKEIDREQDDISTTIPE